MRARTTGAILLVVAMTLSVSCGDDGGRGVDGDAGPGAGSLSAPDPSATASGGTKPAVTVPDGPPPSTLQITDLRVGTGAEAVSGAMVTVHYVGVSYSTGEEFDASWNSGQPFPFVLGQALVIPGWEQGVVGMRVGGSRQLVIPPDLAYGPAGRPPVIAPNETLIFVIDLLAVG